MRAVRTDGKTVTITEVPSPTPGPGEVLIRVSAATVNPVDSMWAAGVLHNNGVVPEGQEVGLGWDAVGVVDALGDRVDDFQVGDTVAGVLSTFGTPLGGLAEHVVLPVNDAARVPAGMSAVDAAVIGMNALTAWQALSHVGPADDRRLLVTGAAGALGGFVVELATRAGWRVTGLARESDAEFIKSRGADLITELAGTYDAVIDAAPLQEAALPAVAAGGAIVGVIGLSPLPETSRRTVHTQQIQPDGARLEELLGLAADGVLTSRVLSTVPITRADEAIAATATGGRRGRWVVIAD